MFRSIAALIFLVLFTTSLIASAFGAHSFGCSVLELTQATPHEEGFLAPSVDGKVAKIDQQGGSTKAPVKATETDCAIHRTHCCNAFAMLTKVCRHSVLAKTFSSKFFDRDIIPVSAPLLEGPFRPPIV